MLMMVGMAAAAPRGRAPAAPRAGGFQR
eukprot:SAG31_NODE_10452_length_1136_cov_29.397300_1_plen_27_part_01